MPHTCANVLLHIIFSTRRRHPLIQPEIKSDLFAYMGGIVRSMRGVALIINGTADHVHILLRIPPAHSVADVARLVKTNSSRWACLLYTSDAADERSSVDLGGRRI